MKYFSFICRKCDFLVGDLRCWLGGADRTIPVPLRRAALAWPSELSGGHQPLLQEGRALLCSGVLSEKVKFSFSAGKAASLNSFALAAGRKTQGCFCVPNNEHSARVSCGLGCSWCPTFGHCSEVLVISGLHRDWGLSRLWEGGICS